MTDNEKRPGTRLVPATCTQCGAALQVDPDREAAVCPYCGTPYIVEKAIQYYNTVHVHNTIHVQQGKKGIFQAAADVFDRQLEREQNARIRAAELQLEQQKIDLIREERRQKARSSFWKKVLWFFGWIYCFPIPVTLLLRRKEDMEPKKKYLFIAAAWLLYFLIFVPALSDSSSDSTASRRTPAPAASRSTPAPAAAKKTPVPAGRKDYEKDIQSSDFRDGTVPFAISTFSAEIPSSWQVMDGYMVAEADENGGTFAFMLFTESELDSPADDAKLKASLGNMTERLMNSEGMTDAVLLGSNTSVTGGITMNRALVHCSFRSGEEYVPCLVRFAGFLGGGGKQMVQFIMIEADGSKAGYRDDFESILTSLKRTETSPLTTPVSDSFEQFRQKMDAYEAFFDSYIAFMRTYDSDDTSAMLEYLSMMAKYAEAIEALDSIDESQLTPEEDAYYLEVMLRIQQKLMTVITE